MDLSWSNRCCFTVSGAPSLLVHLSCVMATQQQSNTDKAKLWAIKPQSHKARVSLQPAVMHTKHMQASGEHDILRATNAIRKKVIVCKAQLAVSKRTSRKAEKQTTCM